MLFSQPLFAIFSSKATVRSHASCSPEAGLWPILKIDQRNGEFASFEVVTTCSSFCLNDSRRRLSPPMLLYFFVKGLFSVDLSKRFFNSLGNFSKHFLHTGLKSMSRNLDFVARGLSQYEQQKCFGHHILFRDL